MQSKKENWTTRDPNHSTFFFLRLFSVYFDHNVLFFWLFFLTQRASLWTQSHFAISSLDFETAFYKSLSNTWLSRVMPGNWVCIFARDRLAFLLPFAVILPRSQVAFQEKWWLTDRRWKRSAQENIRLKEWRRCMKTNNMSLNTIDSETSTCLVMFSLTQRKKERTCQV